MNEKENRERLQAESTSGPTSDQQPLSLPRVDDGKTNTLSDGVDLAERLDVNPDRNDVKG